MGIVENLSSKGYKVTKRASKYGYGVIGLEKELRELGVLGNKRIPENYLKGSIDQRMELLRGLLDTDGNINKTNGIVSFSQCEKRKEIVDSVASLVRSLGGKAKISEALTKVSKESTEYFKSYTVNIWLPKQVGNPFKLERKAGIYDKVARFKPQMLKTWITDVKPVGRHRSRCITVSNPRGLYIANNYIVTHNSHCIAVAASWFITCDPATSINYVSYNSDLVQKQLAVIKGILRSERHRQVWPDMLNWVNERGDIKHKPKGIWQQDKFEVDHPKRGTGVADPTVRAGTVRGTNTGMHCKITIFDDLVTDENYESASDRMDVKRCYESFSKIASTGSKTYAVGTRHDDNDLYKELMEEEAIYYDDDGNEIREKLWEVFERKVEDSVNHTGDGNFIWPRMQMPDGEWYGFDRRELAIKKAKSSNLAFFGAQYYNDPNIFEGAGRLSRKHFKYYDSRHLSQINGKWCIANTPLKIYAAGDLAFTDSSSRNAKKRDFTALAVIGVDHEGNTYILALERFQTDKPEVYFEKIVQLQEYWGFRKIVLESNNAGKIIKNQIEALVRKEGRYLEVEGRAHTSHDGKKEERIEHALVGRYRNGSIYHPKHGMTKMLEEELLASRPPHDDLMDAVSLAVSISKPPVHSGDNIINFKNRPRPQKASRFGGVRGRRGF